MISSEALVEQGRELLTQTLAIWSAGGWAMWAIALIALVMFAMGMHVHLELKRKGGARVAEKTWRRWIEHPEERRGSLGRRLDFVTGGKTVHDTAVSFDQMRSSELPPFERDLKVMKICVGAAPLVGLLGTVTGMLATFGALSSGAGGDETMSMVAGGISEALITTETGLVIALPGLFFQHRLARRFETYKAFLAHLETVVNQRLFERRRRERAIDRAARSEIAQRLAEAVA